MPSPMFYVGSAMVAVIGIAAYLPSKSPLPSFDAITSCIVQDTSASISLQERNLQGYDRRLANVAYPGTGLRGSYTFFSVRVTLPENERAAKKNLMDSNM